MDMIEQIVERFASKSWNKDSWKEDEVTKDDAEDSSHKKGGLRWKRHTPRKKKDIEDVKLKIDEVFELPQDTSLEDIDWERLEPQTGEFNVPSSQS